MSNQSQGTESQSLKSFSHFNKLPLELRCMIWSGDLPPEDDEPALFLATSVTHLTADSACSTADVSHPTFNTQEEPPAKPRHRLIEVASSRHCFTLLHVAREPRDIVLKWASSRGYYLLYRGQTQGHVFARNLDVEKDIVYFPRHGLNWISNEGLTGWSGEESLPRPYVRNFTDRRDNPCQLSCSPLRHIAVQASMREEHFPNLAKLLALMPKLETVSVIWGGWPRAYPKTWTGDTTEPNFTGVNVMPRYELEVEPGPVFRLVYETNMAKCLWEEEMRYLDEIGYGPFNPAAFFSSREPPLGLKKLPENLWNSDTRQSPLQFLDMRVTWVANGEVHRSRDVRNMTQPTRFS